jgi:VWFA-related protein
VIDDLGLDLQSMVAVRSALGTFLEERLQPGDLASILATGGGAVQFTNDRQALRVAIDRLRFNGLADVDGFAAVGAIPVLPRPTSGPGSGEFGQLQRDSFEGGTISALRLVLTGLRDLPGRKSLVFFSKGYALHNADRSLTTFGRAVPGLVDLANRGSVVIYTVDTLGVVTGQLTAADNVASPGTDQSPDDFRNVLAQTLLSRSGASRYANGLDGLTALADPTGGLLLRGQNDLSRQVSRVFEDQKGYYLIGYVPEAAAFATKDGALAYHRIQVKVRRKGLTVRSRKGFFGVADGDYRIEPAIEAGDRESKR